jgi:hypothetical protein
MNLFYLTHLPGGSARPCPSKGGHTPHPPSVKPLYSIIRHNFHFAHCGSGVGCKGGGKGGGNGSGGGGGGCKGGCKGAGNARGGAGGWMASIAAAAAAEVAAVEVAVAEAPLIGGGILVES